MTAFKASVRPACVSNLKDKRSFACTIHLTVGKVPARNLVALTYELTPFFASRPKIMPLPRYLKGVRLTSRYRHYL